MGYVAAKVTGIFHKIFKKWLIGPQSPHTLSGIQKKCYRYVKSMPLNTKLLIILLKVSYYISVI